MKSSAKKAAKKSAAKPKQKKAVGQFLFVWKLKNSAFPDLTKGGTFQNRADSKEESLAMLTDNWGAFFAPQTEAILIKSI